MPGPRWTYAKGLSATRRDRIDGPQGPDQTGFWDRPKGAVSSRVGSEMNNNNVYQRKSGAARWEGTSVVEALSLGRSEPSAARSASVVLRFTGPERASPIPYEHDESHHGCSHRMKFDGKSRTIQSHSSEPCKLVHCFQMRCRGDENDPIVVLEGVQL